MPGQPESPEDTQLIETLRGRKSVLERFGDAPGLHAGVGYPDEPNLLVVP